MLQYAVHPIMKLRQVKLNAAQLKTFTGRNLTYDEYSLLVLSVAQHYDNQMKNNSKNILKRRVYEHNLLDQQDVNMDNLYE